MTERDAIIEAMARAICAAEGFNPCSTETNDEPYWMTWREHAAKALNAALPMLVQMIDAMAERHRKASRNCHAVGARDVAALTSYASRTLDDAADAILALIDKEPGK